MKKWKKRGPVPPKGGRVRITVNLPRTLLPFVKALVGRSLSKKIVGLIESRESSEPVASGFPGGSAVTNDESLSR